MTLLNDATTVKAKENSKTASRQELAGGRDEAGRSSDYQDETRSTVLSSHGYRIGRTIGSGSYAMVKLAESTHHDCIVAIKIISKSHAPQDYLKKFLPREIQVVRGLRHKNLIRFLQAIETTHRVYIAMEYAENGSLLDIIRRDGFIDEDRARVWFSQLLNGLEYCHGKGVVHRDIKCENLLMDSEYNIKISDFGFARGDCGSQGKGYVLSETFCGSYAYASPEILRAIPYRPQYSDVWSTGVVLYATVFGRLPYDDSNFAQLVKQVMRPVVFPKEPTVSKECKQVITKILAPLRQRLKIPEIRKEPWMVIIVEQKSSTSNDRMPATSAESQSSPNAVIGTVSNEPSTSAS
ncbi:testis-specific serine/threonine-protein kinase 4 isoform X2 [Nilaparvata lugens]|uniref:testis-specific serine/threonine-protein kinase 4 isoform X2 n=1 Tax=Nilaparvata lugens TaxID=108931 RepID=UPI00193DBE32|nr:testis-specific serine/threonine-protein kinase 4 isoform X2 [Nilaparvata lugens]